MINEVRGLLLQSAKRGKKRGRKKTTQLVKRVSQLIPRHSCLERRRNLCMPPPVSGMLSWLCQSWRRSQQALGCLSLFYHRSKTLFVMFLSFRSCAAERVSSAFGLERWKVCPASVTRLLPRVILEDPELGSSSPSTVEAEQKTESFGLRHQKSLRTVTFSRGFILGYPRKAVMLVIGVSKLPSMCRHHDDGV